VKAIWPFRNVGIKALSLAMAVLIWFAVSGEETVERGLRVPLEVQQMPAGVELTGDVPTTVDVRVRGGSSTLSRVAAGDVVAVLDLRSARAGRRVFPLTADQVRVPFGVDVVQITPSAIAMVLEGTSSREVPVVPAVDGRPAPGFVVGQMVAEPATVEIVGPESAVKRATEAVTEPVSVTNARERVRETVTIGVLDPSLRLKNTRSAVVSVQIVPAPMERTLRNRPVHLRNLPPNLTAEAAPTAVDVTLRGSREVLNRFEPDEAVAYVDLAGLGAGQYQLTVHADAHEAGVTHIEPTTVQVRIAGVK
jgi:YbbR domain-containing protein